MQLHVSVLSIEDLNFSWNFSVFQKYHNLDTATFFCGSFLYEIDKNKSMSNNLSAVISKCYCVIVSPNCVNVRMKVDLYVYLYYEKLLKYVWFFFLFFLWEIKDTSVHLCSNIIYKFQFSRICKIYSKWLNVTINEQWSISYKFCKRFKIEIRAWRQTPGNIGDGIKCLWSVTCHLSYMYD